MSEFLTRQQQEIICSIEKRIVELKEVKQSLIKTQKDYECAVLERDMLRKQNDRLLQKLKIAGEIICRKCELNKKLDCCEDCEWHGIRDWKLD